MHLLLVACRVLPPSLGQARCPRPDPRVSLQLFVSGAMSTVRFLVTFLMQVVIWLDACDQRLKPGMLALMTRSSLRRIRSSMRPRVEPALLALTSRSSPGCIRRTEAKREQHAHERQALHNGWTCLLLHLFGQCPAVLRVTSGKRSKSL